MKTQSEPRYGGSAHPIAAWAILGILIIFPASIPGLLTETENAKLSDVYCGNKNPVEWPSSTDNYADSSTVIPFSLYQITVSSAIAPPMAIVVSPTATIAVPPSPVQPTSTATTNLEGDVGNPTTNTASVHLPPGSLLDRLTYNKPGILGNKFLYVGLAVVYVVVCTLFLILIYRSSPD